MICISSEKDHLTPLAVSSLSFLFDFSPPVSGLSSSYSSVIHSVSLVILTDGLQASDLSGKDDLHHQVSHQSYESKNKKEPGVPSFWELLVYLFELYSLYF